MRGWVCPKSLDHKQKKWDMNFILPYFILENIHKRVGSSQWLEPNALIHCDDRQTNAPRPTKVLQSRQNEFAGVMRRWTWQRDKLGFLGENKSEATECEVMYWWEEEVTGAGLQAVKTEWRYVLKTWAAFGHTQPLTCDTMLSSEKVTFENHAIKTTTIKLSPCCKFITAC